MKTVVITIFLHVFIYISRFSPSIADDYGFSVELIHRDSSQSPFYNHSLTTFEHLAKTLRRSNSRANYFISMFENKNSTSTELIPDGGAYLMKIMIGTPPVPIIVIADTGSDLIWTQCEPCTDCYKQEAPLFDPRKSSSYKPLPCSSDPCQKQPFSGCRSDNGTCEFAIQYGDESYSKGTLANETLILGSISLPQLNFGCGFDNGGTFDMKESGIVGLGGGFGSLISLLESSIHGKFSYCLGPTRLNTNGANSQINFGSIAQVSGPGVVSTPLVPKSPKTFYHVTLEAFSVGTNRIELLKSSEPSLKGNFFIDSGSTLTHLPVSAYNQLESLVKERIGNKTVKDPHGNSKLCYRISDKPLIPTITAHFTGATIDLNPINTFIQSDVDITCFAFGILDTSVEGLPAVLGSIAQINFLVAYDLVKGTVSFKPQTCVGVS